MYFSAENISKNSEQQCISPNMSSRLVLINNVFFRRKYSNWIWPMVEALINKTSQKQQQFLA